MKQFLIDEQLGNDVLNYLASRPYREVVTLVMRLQSLQLAPLTEELAQRPSNVSKLEKGA